MSVHYELEVRDITGTAWVRQKHERHNSVEDASSAAWYVRRIAKRDTRIVEVTIDERIIHDPNHSPAENRN